MDNIIRTCAICGNSNLKPLHKYNKDHLVRCLSCSFVFSSIRPTQDELDRVYQGYQRGHKLPTQSTIDKLS